MRSRRLSRERRSRLPRGTAPAELTLREIANGLYGRGRIDAGGAAHYDVLEALPNTNTRSYEDFMRIAAHHTSHSGPDGVVDIEHSDGQSVIGDKNLKVRHPLTYARKVIVPGGFHEHAHGMFTYTEMFFACLLAFCKSARASAG